MATEKEMLAEARKRGIVVSSESVLDEEGSTLGEFKKVATSTLKGATKGIIDIFGGWGNLYDYLAKSEEPSALSSAGMVNAISKATGVDVGKIEGYKGAYQFGQAAGPQMAITAAIPVTALAPQLMARAPVKATLFEGAVAGSTGVAAQQIAPDSPFAQLAMQASPNVLSGGLQAYRSRLTAPVGTVPADTRSLLQVGPMTPGEATGSRVQLASEAAAEASPTIEAKGTQFRQQQAVSTESFLNKLFDRASSQAVPSQQATDTLYSAFNNYGKGLSRKLTSNARVDFNAAKKAGGMVDTKPVVEAVRTYIDKIPPETPGLDGLKSKLSEILDVYVTPAKPATSAPSSIVDPSGRPAFTVETAAVPEQVTKIDIDRLQKNLSAWGEAVYSGKADFGKGNIFEGVAPGQVKGIAMEVLRGFRKSLDDAVDQNVPGAAQLKDARDKFKLNLADIEEFSVRPLAKYFDVPNVSALTPETVVAKLKNAKPSERAFLGRVLQDSPYADQIWDTTRRAYFDDIMASAQNAGAAANDPKFVINKALAGLNKNGDFAFLFPDPDDLADARKALTYMQRVSQSAAASGGFISSSKAYEAARASGAGYQSGNIAKVLVDTIDGLIATPNQFANVIFDKDAVKKLAALQNRPNLKKVNDALAAIGKVEANFLARSGPRVAGDTVEVQDGTMQEQPAQEEAAPMDVNSLEEEARRRGLIQ
jgi:hypothetical protein